MNVVGGVGVLGFLLVGILVAALFVVALVSIAQHESANGTEKAIWIAIALCFPFLGPILWFLIGKNSARGTYR